MAYRRSTSRRRSSGYSRPRRTARRSFSGRKSRSYGSARRGGNTIRLVIAHDTAGSVPNGIGVHNANHPRFGVTNNSPGKKAAF